METFQAFHFLFSPSRAFIDTTVIKHELINIWPFTFAYQHLSSIYSFIRSDEWMTDIMKASKTKQTQLFKSLVEENKCVCVCVTCMSVLPWQPHQNPFKTCHCTGSDVVSVAMGTSALRVLLLNGNLCRNLCVFNLESLDYVCGVICPRNQAKFDKTWLTGCLGMEVPLISSMFFFKLFFKIYCTF